MRPPAIHKRTSHQQFRESIRCRGTNRKDLWAYQNGVRIDFSRPGKPTDNAFVESFNGTLREECLNAHWFASLPDAKQTIEA